MDFRQRLIRSESSMSSCVATADTMSLAWIAKLAKARVLGIGTSAIASRIGEVFNS